MFNDLPVEVIQDIFLVYREALRIPIKTIDELDPSNLGPRHSPLILAAVCKVWQHAAFSCPQLWSALEIHLRGVLRTDIPRRRIDVWPSPSTIKLWLERSAGVPLSFKFVEDHPSDQAAQSLYRRDTITPVTTKLIDGLLLQHHLRWEEATLLLSPGTSPSPLHSLTKAESFPSLKILRVTHPESNGSMLGPVVEAFVQDFLDTVSGAPCLSELALDSAFIQSRSDLELLKQGIPWQQLTRVSMLVGEYHNATFTILDILEILSASPHLVFLEAHIENSVNSPFPSLSTLPRVRSNSLEELIIKHCANFDPTVLLTFTTLPNLRSLSIPWNLDPSRDAFPFPDALAQFIERSSCQLKEFQLSSQDSTFAQPGTTYPSLLQALWILSPSLTCLRLYIPDVSDVLEALVSRPPPNNANHATDHDMGETRSCEVDVLCPHLTSLSLSSVHVDSEKRIAMAIASRWKPAPGSGVATLQYASVHFGNVYRLLPPNAQPEEFKFVKSEGVEENIENLMELLGGVNPHPRRLQLYGGIPLQNHWIIFDTDEL